MKRILSGVQATGDLHIGNYLGAIKPCVDLQNDGESIYFVPNLHSLNIAPDPDKLREETFANIAWFIAAGIDPKKSILYIQSDVSANAELCWILNNYVTMGELSRQTEYKDKSLKRGAKGQLAALFTYPVLMAADILLYSANVVPVGEDQKQHVELARNIAERFNNKFGPTFVVPEPVIRRIGARVMSLQDPTSKMSKSNPNQSGSVLMLDDPAVVKAKFKRALTDSGDIIEASEKKPALTNLLQIYSGFTGESIESVQEKYSNKGYGEFKTDLGVLVANELSAVQTRYKDLIKDKPKLQSIIDEGAEKAREIAEPKLGEVKKKIGLL